jgi:hypothetical protein
MAPTAWLILLFLLPFAAQPAAVSGQSPTSYSGLPQGAVILDEQSIAGWAHHDRRLLFWALPPHGKPLVLQDTVGDLEYTCPVQTSGHSRELPARVSLVDTRTRKILNTIPVNLGAGDEYDVPLRIRPGYYYEVRGPLKGGEGKPHILALHDFNGDGKALEFAFYVMESCNGPLTMVMGYSQRQDRVIAYQFSFNPALPSEPAGPRAWMYRFTFRKPIDKMHWHYVDDYNSGARIEYDFRYLPDRERFEGVERQVGGPAVPANPK